MKWTSTQLRRKFHVFFEQHDHKTLPSSSVIPIDDPTLLFVNSGMVQFKNIILGESPMYKRVNTIQHCIRAGGKHNDLDDVGKDNYHHTFFEMMGNWSFGDYFKEQAIQYAYEFLVDVLKLDKDRLYVTIYEEMDVESRNIWKKYFPDEKIINGSHKDNFWEMGEFGPCGPCTEIHYDRIGNRDARNLVNKDDPNVIEIWNIVFMEFNKTPKGLLPLEVKKIDTGIGLERLLSILNNVKSNYLIDTFLNIINFIEIKCNMTYNDEENTIITTAFRVVADHARTLAICLYYNVSFSNEGRGYVLRRILRRAVRFASEILNINDNVLSEIVQKAAQVLNLSSINVSVIDYEEKLFKKTLKNGLIKLNKIIEAEGKISSENAFLLYDTYGFPKDLTKIIADEKGIEINLDKFEHLLNNQKKKSKGEKDIISIKFEFDKTDDKFKYTHTEIKGELQAIIFNNEIVHSLDNEQEAQLIFNKTCFYGECGGQVGDTGTITFFDNDVQVGWFNVINTKIVRGYVLHYGKLFGKISINGLLKINNDRRINIRNNHSSCHIIGGLIKQFISTNAEQKGSYVDEFKCTYDFNYLSKISDSQLIELEKKANDFICSGINITVQYLSKKEVLDDPNIILMKNVEYPEPMRVIVMKSKDLVLKELCGGTHAENLQDIKKIRIINENGVSMGVRRITLVSGKLAEECDQNVIKIKKAIENNEILPLNILLPIVDKRKFEIQYKELIKQQNKETQKHIDQLICNIKNEILNNTLAKLTLTNNKVNIIKKKIDYFKANKKVCSKIIVSIGNIFVELQLNSYIYMDINETEYLIYLFLNNGNEIYNKIIAENNKVRIINNTLQGTIEKTWINNFLNSL